MLDDDDPNESRYLGQNSIAAFLSEETNAGAPVEGDHDVIRQDIMPILGLQISSAPYPFMSKEHMDKIRSDIAAALPSDREVLKYVILSRSSLSHAYSIRTFQIYKQIVQPFWGLLIDVEDFESKLCIYLEDRVSNSRHPGSSKGVSSAWLGMLFAVLAVATNYSELSYHKRVATSQAYGMSRHPHLDRTTNYKCSSNLFSLPTTFKFHYTPLPRIATSSSDIRIRLSKRHESGSFLGSNRAYMQVGTGTWSASRPS